MPKNFLESINMGKALNKLEDTIQEAKSCLPANPDPDLVIGALAYMVWAAREDLKDLKQRLEECTG